MRVVSGPSLDGAVYSATTAEHARGKNSSLRCSFYENKDWFLSATDRTEIGKTRRLWVRFKEVSGLL